MVSQHILASALQLQPLPPPTSATYSPDHHLITRNHHFLRNYLDRDTALPDQYPLLHRCSVQYRPIARAASPVDNPVPTASTASDGNPCWVRVASLPPQSDLTLRRALGFFVNRPHNSTHSDACKEAVTRIIATRPTKLSGRTIHPPAALAAARTHTSWPPSSHQHLHLHPLPPSAHHPLRATATATLGSPTRRASLPASHHSEPLLGPHHPHHPPAIAKHTATPRLQSPLPLPWLLPLPRPRSGRSLALTQPVNPRASSPPRVPLPLRPRLASTSTRRHPGRPLFLAGPACCLHQPRRRGSRQPTRMLRPSSRLRAISSPPRKK